jgi:hypothetical protein
VTTVTAPRCPEAVLGQHGEANTSGRCPYCGNRIGPRRNSGPSAQAQAVAHSAQHLDVTDTSYPREWRMRYDQHRLDVDPDALDEYQAEYGV